VTVVNPAPIGARRLRRDLAALVERGDDVREFSLKAARMLDRSVPFDGVSVLTLDPATGLPTGEVAENALPEHARARLARCEFETGDVNTFEDLIASGQWAASLSEATDGDLHRSVRHRELRAPNGFGDELRAVLVSETSAWGALTLERGRDRAPFTPAEVELVASLSGHLAEGLRRAIVDSALTAEHDEDVGHPGLALLAADDSILMTDPPADRWLAELASDGGAQLPPVVAAVASRARGVGDGGDPALARARVHTPSSTWLMVRGTTVTGGGEAHTAITLEPAGADDLAPLVAHAYGLTERERAVTELIALGLSTDDIAARLHLSRWTVQDHLKSVFDKVGVCSRGRLVARVFLGGSGEQCARDAAA
jgi:DNA-binding CsgD family transcriptional regulator